MQICFSIASKGSTVTQHMDSFQHLMPSLMNRDLENFSSKNFDAKSLANAPNGLASQMRIMEEIGRSCRETPITIMDSESTSHF